MALGKAGQVVSRKPYTLGRLMTVIERVLGERLSVVSDQSSVIS